MNIPFRLRRRGYAEPAVALFLPGFQVSELVRLCARLADSGWPVIYRVADGFLVKLSRPTTALVPGAVRLCSRAGDLLIPVDAELIPALLDEEAVALVRKRGLVFLPDGRVLEYAVDHPLPASALLTVTSMRRQGWEPLPEARGPAERLIEIEWESQDSAEDLIEEGGGQIGTEDPRPEDANLPARAAGKTLLGVGKGLSWLGRATHVRGLERLGAKMVARALAMAPRLAEALLGKQEASLRFLLRMFRQGDIERALRRAVPLTDDLPRGARPAAGFRLPFNNILYSLRTILAGAGGPGSYWFSPDNAYWQLQQEYRKNAERAAAEGDFRRAAFIYGKLLQDFRSAAVVLGRGGLHRDAAILYLKKVDDPLAAAREFAAAGDLDRALSLYRSLGEHALAADLLKQAGDEDQALMEYQQAAQELFAAGDAYQAGELLESRAGRADLAFPYYESGWGARPRGAFVPCAIRLAQRHVQAVSATELLRLVDEIDEFFHGPENAALAAEIYNELARLADPSLPAGLQDDLRDRALVGIAAKMRQHSGTTNVSQMMGPATVWPAALVGDAEFAVSRARKRRQARDTQRQTAGTALIRAGESPVTAVCRAPGTGRIFFGFQSGAIVAFYPRRGGSATEPNAPVVFYPRRGDSVTECDTPVLSLATSDTGDIVVAQTAKDGQACLTSFFHYETTGFRRVVSRTLPAAQIEGVPVRGLNTWLSPLVACGGEGLAAFWDGSDLCFLRAVSLLPQGRLRSVESGRQQAQAALFLPLAGAENVGLITLADRLACYYPVAPVEGGRSSADGFVSNTVFLGWNPSLPEQSTLIQPHLSFLRTGTAHLEIAGIRSEGGIFWSELQFNVELSQVSTHGFSAAEPIKAVTLLEAGRLAAVSDNGVLVLRHSGSGFQIVNRKTVALPDTIACFPHHPGNELLVISSRGAIARVALS